MAAWIRVFSEGSYFYTLLGAAIPPNLRRISCASSSYKYIFRRSCANKSVPAYTDLSATARKVGTREQQTAAVPQPAVVQ